MRFGSLFSGIGGIDLGLERAGMRCAWQCEIDPFCRKVLAKHWPGIECHEDVRAINETAKGIDLLCGGFPCQPHSVAGKRRGAEDERNLWPECIRLVRLLFPGWCLFENVPGLLTTMFGQVCDDLQREGYEVWTFLLGADDVGAPHRRKRVWIVANNQSQRPRTRRAKSEVREWESEFIGNSSLMVHTESIESERGDTGKTRVLRWPARPGKLQHKWEHARLVSNPNPRAGNGQRNQRNESNQRSDGNAGAKTQLCREAQPGVGESAHGLSRRLARLRREQLKALGNAVVPQVAELLGRAIMEAEQ